MAGDSTTDYACSSTRPRPGQSWSPAPPATSAGRLVPRLLEAGHTVKVLVRSPDKIAGVPWRDDVEVVESSLDDGDALRRGAGRRRRLLLPGPLHGGRGGLRSQGKGHGPDRRRSRGGRRRAADCLPGRPAPQRAWNCPPTCGPAKPWARCSWTAAVDAIVFQAGVVIGSGSASFEMIRHLSETLPLMPAPSWVRNRIEAIAVRDVLHYLVCRGAPWTDPSTAPSTSAAGRC